MDILCANIHFLTCILEAGRATKKRKKEVYNKFFLQNLWDKIKWNKIKYKKKGERISTLKASSHFNVHVICIKNCINVNDEDSKSFMFPVPIFTVIWMYNFHLPHFTFTPWNEIKHYKGLNVRFLFFVCLFVRIYFVDVVGSVRLMQGKH